MDLFEILLILAIALIVIGPERLPEVLRVTGKVLRELRLASNTVMRELTEALDENPPRPPVSHPIGPPEPPKAGSLPPNAGGVPPKANGPPAQA
ncbi:MAG TPA: twin-arginine translocase TatA/TatE family subunit [Candidatus Binataceae bacterium]|nr:twin-arginine translocase TatA/TatE family subunit [Candidatus Binataceae bacterium]